MYVATINTPGYLPWDDDPPVFDSADEAWDYLYEQRLQHEEDVAEVNGDEDAQFSGVVDRLRALATDPDSTPGTIYGSNPMCDPAHDLGYAYCVTETNEEN